MRQSDSVSEELDTENVQCALDFENTMNELETQLYYRHLPPKEVALRVMEAACKFYDAHCYILRQQHLFIIGVTIL